MGWPQCNSTSEYEKSNAKVRIVLHRRADALCSRGESGLEGPDISPPWSYIERPFRPDRRRGLLLPHFNARNALLETMGTTAVCG